jgi:hypothetical protein
MYIEPNVKDSMYMDRIFSPPLAESGIKGRMPRRKVFETNINLPITGAQLARIAAVLRVEVGEARAAFIRHAIEVELQRRETAAAKKGTPRQRPGRKRS